MERRPWRTSELATLRDMARRGVESRAIAAALCRSVKCVRQYASRRGIRLTNPNWWSPEEDAEMRRLIDAGRSFAQIAKAVGRSEKSCQWHASQVLGIRQTKRWTYYADRILRKSIHLPVADVAERLGCTPAQVRGRRERLGLATNKGSEAHRRRLSEVHANSQRKGGGGRTRGAHPRAAHPDATGWPDGLTLNQCRILTVLDDARQAGEAWVRAGEISARLGVKDALNARGAMAKLMAAGLCERRRLNAFLYDYRLAPGVVRLVERAAPVEHAADFDAEHERRILMLQAKYAREGKGRAA